MKKPRILKKLSQIESLINYEHSENGINTQITSLVDDIRCTITQSVSKPGGNLYRLIFEKAPIGIVHFDEDGIVTACNSQFVKIFDSSREKLIGLPMTELPNKELVSNVMKALKGEEGVYEGRYEAVTSGKTVYIRATFNPIETSGGIAIVEDTTDRYLADQKLKESEYRFRSIFENKHSVMLIIDPTDGQIVDANPAAINFYGWELDEIKKKKISEINTLSEQEIEREIARAKTNKSHLFHFKHKLSDGTIKDVEVFSGTIQIDEQLLLFSVINDISDRIKKDKDLQKFKLGIARSSNVVFITDKDGAIEYVNKAFTELYGYDKDEAIGRTPRILKSGKHSDKFYDQFWDTILGGKVIESELQNRTADGEIVNIHATANPILDKDEELLGFIAIQQNITEEKKSKERLEHTEQQLRDIIEHSTNMFYTHDVEGKLTYVSPQSKEIYGVEPDKALRNWTDYITDHPLNEQAKELTDKAIQTGVVQPPYRLQIRRADGELIWVKVNEAPVIKNGEVVGITGSFTNITKEVEASEKSEKSRILLDELTNQTSAAVWARDCNGSYIFTNREYKRLFSVKGDKLVDKTVDELFNNETASQFKCNDEKVLEKDSPLIFERWITIDGEERFFRINMFPLPGLPGSEKSVGGVAIDITDQKKSEEVIQASLTEKETLLSEIHHRVKNNLAVISGLLELSMMNVNDERVSSVLQSSQLRIQAMAKVHELLYQSESFSQISFKDYLESIIDTIRSTFDERDFKPNFITYIEEIPLNINHAIPSGMIVNELITNSINHAFPDKEMGDITVNFHKEGDKIVLQVVDNGKGVNDNFEAVTENSLGMTLIKILSQQLNADLKMGNTINGFQTTVKFNWEEGVRGSSGNL